ncbi:MAG: hypothetical protein ABSH20_10240, partial [Tepidisphaeraceae bacterium]
RIPSGGTARIKADVPAARFVDKLDLELSEPPDGITIKSFNTGRDGMEIVVQCDAAKIKPGLKGNLVVSAFTETAPAGKENPQSKPQTKPEAGPQAKPPARPQANQRRILLGSLPAIPFEVVSP